MTDRPDEPAAPPPTEAPKLATRRDLLDAALVGGGVLLAGSVVYPVVAFVNAPATPEAESLEVVAAKDGDVKPGSAVSFRFGTKPALLVRDHGGRLHAFIALCTHLDCVVKFRQDLGHIWCACHNGHFDLQGRNIQGPPPRPLTPLVVELRGDDVLVRRA